MIALDNLLPGSCVASHAATEWGSYDLGVFQPALPGTPGFVRLRTAKPAGTPPRLYTQRYVFVLPKVLCSYEERIVAGGAKRRRNSEHAGLQQQGAGQGESHFADGLGFSRRRRVLNKAGASSRSCEKL